MIQRSDSTDLKYLKHTILFSKLLLIHGFSAIFTGGCIATHLTRLLHCDWRSQSLGVVPSRWVLWRRLALTRLNSFSLLCYPPNTAIYSYIYRQVHSSKVLYILCSASSAQFVPFTILIFIIHVWCILFYFQSRLMYIHDTNYSRFWCSLRHFCLSC